MMWMLSAHNNQCGHGIYLFGKIFTRIDSHFCAYSLSLSLLLCIISATWCWCALRTAATVCIWCGFHNQWMANIIHIRFVECALTAPRTWSGTNAGSKRASSQIRMMFTGLIAVIQWICSSAWWNAWCAATRTHLWHIWTTAAGDFLETGARTKAFANDTFECESKIFRK